MPADVVALRKRQAKNFLCLLLLANGTPMLRGGDEFLQTQRGNNNPYNQDNETSWLDWSRLDTYRDVFRFARLMIAFRKAHPSLGRSRFWRHDVRWYGVESGADLSHGSRSIAYHLSGASQGDDDLYVMVSAYWEPLEFVVQEGQPSEWRRVVDTGRESPGDICEPGRELLLTSVRYTVGPRSIVVLVRPRARAVEGRTSRLVDHRPAEAARELARAVTSRTGGPASSPRLAASHAASEAPAPAPTVW